MLPAWIARVAAPLAILGADGASVLVANEAGRRLLAVPEAAAAPWRLEALVGALAANSLAIHLRAEPVGGPDDWLALRCETAAGGRHVAVSLKRAGDVWVATLEDRTPATQLLDEELSWRENLAAIANWLPVGIEIYDGRFRELFANTQSHRVFDYGEAYFGRHDDWWELGFPDPATRSATFEEWRAKVEDARRYPGKVQESEWTVRCSDGADRSMLFRYRFLGDFYVVIFWDVSEQRQLEAELRRLAGTDALTGLPNRRSFMDAARHAAARQAEPLALLMLDLDHFKAINDRFGHAVGDRALQVTAERCRQVLRDGDVIARIGGEEFAVLLPATGIDGARLVADRLHGVIRRTPFSLGPLAIEVRASVGGALAPADAGIDALLDRADRALYVAKSTGRDRVVFADGAG
jgi:diguanylate cyclase (GGDEF)-like protein